jgi:hypothetical protein
MIQHTQHSLIRSAQRGLTDEEIEYVFQFGSRYHRGGALIYFLRHKDMPLPDHRSDWAMHLEGTALILDKEGNILLTVWRNRGRGLKIIRKKSPYRSSSIFEDFDQILASEFGI